MTRQIGLGILDFLPQRRTAFFAVVNRETQADDPGVRRCECIVDLAAESDEAWYGCGTPGSVGTTLSQTRKR